MPHIQDEAQEIDVVSAFPTRTQECYVYLECLATGGCPEVSPGHRK